MSLTRHSSLSMLEKSSASDKELEVLLPYYKSPFTEDSDGDPRHLRQRSNIIELFFDLFLAADLATFTEKHSTNDKDSLVAFIGFFIVIWTTWFQITLHDVRFAEDSIYERGCKFFQFVIFVAFALVGADFQSESSGAEGIASEDYSSEEMTNFWLLSFTLFSSRLLLAFQYLAVFFSQHRPSRLQTPLLLHVLVLTVSAAAFVGLIGLFGTDGSLANRGASHGYVTWYLLLISEVVGVLCISMTWKELNFAYTHLTERMGLLTFIMIGEGAIGAAHTTIEIMSDRALSAEPVFLIVCIVLVLILLWTMYFDGLLSIPHGSLWQSVWACLHMPLHLSFIGILQSTRQVVAIRYVDQTLHSFVGQTNNLCLNKHEDGVALGDSILRIVTSYEYGMLQSTSKQSTQLRGRIQNIANTPGICAAMKTTNIDTLFDVELPNDLFIFKQLLNDFAASLSDSSGADSSNEDVDPDGFTLVKNNTVVVYLYYWSFALLMLLTFSVLYRLNLRRNDISAKLSMTARGVMALLCALFLALHTNAAAWTSFIASLGMLPTLCAILGLLVVVDRVGIYVRRKSICRGSAQDHSLHDGTSIDNFTRGNSRNHCSNPRRELVRFTRFSMLNSWVSVAG